MGTKIHKRLFILLGALFVSVNAMAFWASPGAAAATAGFTDTQIKAAKGFSFSSGGSVVTGTIAGQPVKFTGGPSLLQMSAAQLQAFKSEPPGSSPFEYKVSPSDEFCKPSRTSTTPYPNEFVIYPSQLTLNSAQTKVTSATGYLVAYAGKTDASCAQVPSGTPIGSGSGNNGVVETVSVTQGPPAGKVITQSSLNSAKYVFGGNASVINATFKLADGSTANTTFTDVQPYDSEPNYAPDDTSLFCSASGVSAGGLNFAPSSRGIKTISLTLVNLPVVTDASGDCAQGKEPASNQAGSKVDNSNLNAEKMFSWQGDQLQSYGSKSTLTLGVDNKIGQNSNRLYDDGSGCGANSGWVVLLSSAKSNSGTLYHLTNASSGRVVNGYYNACAANDSTPQAVTITGTWSQAPSGGGGGGGPTADCEANAATSNISGHELSFVACPMIDAADSAAQTLTDQISNLLAFNVQSSLNSGGSQAKLVWANIRDISSILLVIIMLIMVLSQAVSWGPFDAYTVRKVLPRLIIAVIAMQISWSLLIYIFQLFNDIGRGVADLMYGPFGGPNGVSISAALGNIGVTPTEASLVNWAAVAGVVTLAVLSLPTIAIAAWAVIVALATGFIVLIFRQILLLACLIFAPLAMLLWIMPGTQRYWKLWYDNFSKLLVMFPLIMGMLAAGKIFAMLAGGIAGGTTVLKFIFVMVGFYGPYFIIPKTYKWGGQLMSMGAGFINTATQHGQGPVGNYLQGVRERSRWHLAREARKGELNRRAKADFAEGLTTGNRFRRGINRSRLLGVYKFNPRAEADVNRRIVRTAQAQREEELSKRGKEAVDPLIQEGNFDAIADLAQNGTEHEQEAAVEALINARRWQVIEARGIQSTDAWRRTLNKKGALMGTVIEARSDLAPFNAGRSTMQIATGSDGNGGMAPSALVTQHSTFWEDLANQAPAASNIEIDDLTQILNMVARDPRAMQIVNSGSEAHVDALLSQYASRRGTPPMTFRQLIEQQRQPQARVPAIAPTVAPAPGGGHVIGTRPIVTGAGDIMETIHNEPETATVARANAAGGWDAYAAANPDQVMFIHQNKTGAIRDAAERALRNQGIIP